MPENMAKLSLEPELILICRVSSSFDAVDEVESSLRQTLQASVDSFDFARASLVLAREDNNPVWWHASKNLPDPKAAGKNHDERCSQLSKLLSAAENKQRKILLDPLAPVVSSTLPVILKAGGLVGMMEIGIFNTDYQSAKYLLAKAVSLGRHIADIIQESLFQRQKDLHLRKLAVWLEMVNTISSTLDIRQVLHVVAQLTADLFSAKSCIYLLDEQDQTLIPAVAVGSYDPSLKKKFKALKGSKPFQGIKQAIKTQQPVLVTPKNISRMLTRDIIDDFAYGWVVLAPILSKEKTIGIMQVDRPLETDGFDSEDTEIIFAIARATAVAMENARLIEVLGQKEQTLHQLLNKLITAQEDERKRLASDLHDGIIQSLIAIWYRLQRISPEEGLDPQIWHGEINELTDVLNEQIQEIKRILYDLRPIILDNYGLIPAVESYVDNIQDKYNLPIELTLEGEKQRLPSKIEVTLFRILQEALTNVIKHAGATRVIIRLSIMEKEAALDVADNGSGINDSPIDKPQLQNRLGLASIQERALLLGGNCTIDSQPGKGTRVTVKIPV
jgi:signal transduction histidine kinase